MTADVAGVVDSARGIGVGRRECSDLGLDDDERGDD